MSPENQCCPEECLAIAFTALRALGRGLSNRAIADELRVSEHTVKFHLATIYGKLGVSTRTEALRQGLRRGLIEL